MPRDTKICAQQRQTRDLNKQGFHSLLHVCYLNQVCESKMPQDLAPAVFGVCQGVSSVSCEKGRALSIRIQLTGTRTVVAASCSQLRTYMTKAGISSIVPETLLSFFKSMAKEVIEAYTKEGNVIYKCTLGPNEILCLPFDWVFAEEVQKAGNDVCGIKFLTYLKADLDEMVACSRWLVSSQKPNDMLQTAIDTLEAAM